MIKTAIEGITLRNGEILPEEVPHGTVIEPVTVQAPFTAGVDQAIGDQGLEHIQPARSFAAGWQARLPKGVQLQQVPQPAGQPTRAPLSGTTQLQSAQFDLHHCARQFRRRAVLRKQRQLRRSAGVLVEDGNGTAPSRALNVVDLPEIQHMALHHPPIRDTAILHHAPVAVFFAVFLADFGP
jgi:hypothetical protein